MGRRSNFQRIAKDFYPTIDPRSIPPLLPHLSRRPSYVEPFAGAGDLIRLLAPHATCTFACDVEPRAGTVENVWIRQSDAFDLKVAPGDIVISNPPWSRPLLHRAIEHFADQCETWMLFDSAWGNTKQARPFLDRCRKIVAVGRLIWIPGTRQSGKEDVSWYAFGRSRPGSAPVFYGRGVAPVEPPAKGRVCFDCRRVIGRQGRWKLAERAGVVTCVHRCCENPTGERPRGAADADRLPLFERLEGAA